MTDKTVRERDVEDYLLAQVKALGGETRKVKWLDRDGAPDRLVMLPEIASRGPAGTIPAERFLVELKAPGKKPTATQLREHERLRKFGWRVEVVDSFERVNEVLR
jgi:hypothetical protein